MRVSCNQMMPGERSLAGALTMARESGLDGLDLRGDRIESRVGGSRTRPTHRLPVPTRSGRVAIPLPRTIGERLVATKIVRRRLRAAAAIGASGAMVPIAPG